MSSPAQPQYMYDSAAQNRIWSAFKELIAPAVLADADSSVLATSLAAIMTKVRTMGLPITSEKDVADSMLVALKAILFEPRNGLTWTTPPKALQRQEPQERPMSSKEGEAAFAKKREADEAKRAKAKKDEAAWKACDEAIASFHPVNNRGMLDIFSQEREQKLLRDHIAAEKTRNVNPADVLTKVREYLADYYQREEASRVRM